MKIQKNTTRVDPELERVVNDLLQHGNLDACVTTVILISQRTDLDSLFVGFESHYHGFKVIARGYVAVCECPAKYVMDIAKHDGIIAIKRPTPYENPQL